ncbi:unnamed protein product [Prunus armeniaca]|uniref:Uncharacterized protein n=1 Tax=Prunus armeniaca TaxID=36596 RepID=A0A6J5TF15_PRUAR|nr:unnamed protein product [Prunus armeniaca]CAB4293064.1 unnamed protein product [Prunus armeniaca]
MANKGKLSYLKKEKDKRSKFKWWPLDLNNHSSLFLKQATEVGLRRTVTPRRGLVSNFGTLNS